jgi:hypothetical protein
MATDQVSIRQMAAMLTEIDRKLDELTTLVRTVASLTARDPSGRTLINLVASVATELEAD